MDSFIIEAISRAGYVGIFLLMALENIFPPIPSEVIMGVSGVLVGRGELAFWPLLFIATAGTTAGNMVWYWLGHRWGYERLQPIVERHGRWFTLEWQQIERAQGYFVKHGHWVVFLFRFSPFMRTIISLPAGLVHMPLGRFLAVTFAGSLIWNGLLIKGGELLGSAFADSQEVLGWAVLGLIGLGVAIYVYRVVTWKPSDSGED